MDKSKVETFKFEIPFDEKPKKGYKWKSMGYIVPKKGDRVYIGEWAVIYHRILADKYPTMRMVKIEKGE